MGTNGKVTGVLNKEDGMVLVYVAMVIVLLVFCLAMAVDMSYRHVAKAELQNAADSAALAGATLLPRYTSAQSAAIAYAAKNSVVGNPRAPVAILPSDVTIGYYDKIAGNVDPSRTPKNAVQVMARRDQETDTPEQQSKLDLFFSKLFNYPKIAVKAMAIAQRPPATNTYILLNKTVCDLPKSATNPDELATPLALDHTGGTFAWTSLGAPQTGGANVSDLICSDAIPSYDACNQDMYTTNGTASKVFKDMEGIFFDPDYDKADKSINSGIVTSWTVIVPTTDGDPSLQPSPFRAWGYASIRVKRACGSGSGKPCGGDRDFKAPAGVCAGGENDIVIDKISCYSCDSEELYGPKASLVQ